jgi:hypothetical protein
LASVADSAGIWSTQAVEPVLLTVSVSTLTGRGRYKCPMVRCAVGELLEELDGALVDRGSRGHSSSRVMLQPATRSR